jgi:hypothetical protein
LRTPKAALLGQAAPPNLSAASLKSTRDQAKRWKAGDLHRPSKEKAFTIPIMLEVVELEFRSRSNMTSTRFPLPPSAAPPSRLMLSPQRALQVLRRYTGAFVGRSTFYRWINTGRVYSIRMGFRIYVPWETLQDTINHCLAGERF